MIWPTLYESFAEALRPPRRVLPSEWAEEHFRLTNAAEAGRYRGSRTPYVAGVVDTLAEPGVEEVVWVAGTQVAKTTGQELFLAYAVANDPGPALIVKPSEQACEEFVKERIRPMLEAVLPNHLSPRPHDNTLSAIRLDSMALYFGWAGSPQSLASRPCRYVLCDEVDKYPPFAGREADPVSLAKERTATYLHRKRVFQASTPTTRDGAIWRAFEGCGDRRRFHVPCPHCGTYQVLTWPQVKWPKLAIADKVALADEIERARLAWYECGNPDCRAKIEESHKPRMLERGVWASEGQTVTNAGALVGDRPESRRVGFHLSSLYSPWRKLWEIAAEFIRAAGDVAATMNFRNSRLAEPFEVQVTKAEPSLVREKAVRGSPRMVIPSWAWLVVATADVQATHLYYTVRAWGYANRSHLVDHGVVNSFETLWDTVFAGRYRFETGGGSGSPQILVIDSGYRKDEVYEFARLHPGVVFPSKGMSTKRGAIAAVVPKPQDGVILWDINTHECKNLLSRLMREGDKWMPHRDVDDDYCSQVTAEHLVVDPQTRQMEWKTKTNGADNHYFDCEVLSAAVAWRHNCDSPEPPPAANPAARKPSEWVGDVSDWLPR